MSLRGQVLWGLATMAMATVLAGCTVGYRYHNVDSAISNVAGANAQVTGSGHMIELGLVLDVRYLRLVTPFLGSNYDIQIKDDHGRFDRVESVSEVRATRIDVPVVSVWNAQDSFSLGYPGTMVHRQSIELWLSATGRLTSPPRWYGDVGLVYYHDDLVAVRAFGGVGGYPYDGITGGLSLDGAGSQSWEASPRGWTGGVELTVGAGEQALDFVKYFIGTQESVEEQMDH